MCHEKLSVNQSFVTLWRYWNKLAKFDRTCVVVNIIFVFFLRKKKDNLSVNCFT